MRSTHPVRGQPAVIQHVSSGGTVPRVLAKAPGNEVLCKHADRPREVHLPACVQPHTHVHAQLHDSIPLDKQSGQAHLFVQYVVICLLPLQTQGHRHAQA